MRKGVVFSEPVLLRLKLFNLCTGRWTCPRLYRLTLTLCHPPQGPAPGLQLQQAGPCALVQALLTLLARAQPNSVDSLPCHSQALLVSAHVPHPEHCLTQLLCWAPAAQLAQDHAGMSHVGRKPVHHMYIWVATADSACQLSVTV